MCAAQGLDFRAPLSPGKKLIPAHERIRELVTHLDRDRVLSGDIGVLARAIADGEFA
jgi:histidine ammonia-lyase